MSFVFSRLQAYAALAVAAVLASALAWQTYQLSSERTAHQALQLQVTQQANARLTAALSAEINTALQESAHVKTSQENANVFITKQPVQAAADRADAAIAERVRRAEAGRAATYQQMARACAATASDSANQLRAFDRQLTAGVGVVANLRRDLGRRDAEVVLLHGQVVADRALLASGPTPAPK